jgi:hypothetical protein
MWLPGFSDGETIHGEDVSLVMGAGGLAGGNPGMTCKTGLLFI